MNDVLKVTVIGQDLFKIVQDKFELVGINKVNQLKNGMLGNLKTLTYFIEIPQDKVIKTRARLMKAMEEDSLRLMPMYDHGDWMRIFVMKPLTI